MITMSDETKENKKMEAGKKDNKKSRKFRIAMIIAFCAVLSLGFAFYLELAKRDPSNWPKDVFFKNTEDLLGKKKTAKVHDIVETGFERFPGRNEYMARLYFLDGRAYRLDGELEKALEQYEKGLAVEDVLDHIKIPLQQGIVEVLRLKREYEDAFERLKTYFEEIKDNNNKLWVFHTASNLIRETRRFEHMEYFISKGKEYFENDPAKLKEVRRIEMDLEVLSGQTERLPDDFDEDTAEAPAHSEKAEVILNLLQSLVEKDNFNATREAADKLKNLKDLNPEERGNYYIRAADIFKAAGLREEAVDMYRHMIDEENVSRHFIARAYLEYANQARERNDFSTALEYFKKAEDKFSDFPQFSEEAMGQRAVTHRIMNQLDQALEILEKLIDETSESRRIVWAQTIMSEIYRQKGETGKAKSILEKIIRSSGDKIDVKNSARSGLANIYKAEKQYDKALELFDAIYEEATDRYRKAWALELKAVLFKERGKFEDAEKVYSQIIEEFSDLSSIHTRIQLDRIYMLRMMGKNQEAVKEYQKLKETTQRPDEGTMVYEALANTYQGQGNFEKALEVFTEIEEQWPGNRKARLTSYRGRALALKGMNRNEEAAQEFEKLLKLQPDPYIKRLALMNLAELYCGLQKQEKAKEFYDRLKQEAPNSAEVGRVRNACGFQE